MADGCIPVPVVRSRGAGGGALAMPVLLCDWIPGMAEAPWFGWWPSRSSPSRWEGHPTRRGRQRCISSRIAA